MEGVRRRGRHGCRPGRGAVSGRDDAGSEARARTVRLSRDSPSFGRRTFFVFAYCPVGTTPFPKHGQGRSDQARCFLDEGDFFARSVPDLTRVSGSRSPNWGLPEVMGPPDRKSVGGGKSGAGRVVHGGGR